VSPEAASASGPAAAPAAEAISPPQPAADVSTPDLGMTPPSVPAVPRSDQDPVARVDEIGPPPAPRPQASTGGAAPALVLPMPRPASQPRATPTPARVERPVESGSKRTAPRPVAQPAGAGARLCAGLLDAVLVLLLQALVLAPGYLYWAARPQAQAPSEVSFLPIAVSLALVPLALLLGGGYFVYFWGVRGASPGKGLFGLAVEGEDGAFPVGMGRAAMRALGYVLSLLVLGIGFVMILFGGRGLHDHIAGTRVVRRGA
jgi:uncharacterized RDD family membrane protein YckC